MTPASHQCLSISDDLIQDVTLFTFRVAEPSSTICFRLKYYRGKLLPIRMVGSVTIEMHDLLDQRQYDQNG